MSITVTLTPATRSGTCTSPLAALSLETIAFSGGVIADQTQVMVMLPDGSPLALGETLNGVCEINLKTKEAHSATAGIAAGELVRCVLVIGDTNTLRYVVPAQLQRNYLEDMIPPSESVPSYPTQDDLAAILDEINSARTDVVGIAEGFPSTVENAKTEINQAKETAVVSVETKASEVSGELDDKVTAAQEAQEMAETAQEGAEAAQEAAETALNNGCVYQVRVVASPAITLDKTLTAYKHAPTADTTYTFSAPAEAQGKIIVFWLWVVQGETAHQLTFPAGVTWLSEGAFAANTETLLAFMSTDGGASWQANVQWERAVSA